MESDNLRFLRRINNMRDIASKWPEDYKILESAHLKLLEEINMLRQIGFAAEKANNILVASDQLEKVKEVTAKIEFSEINKVHLQELPNLRSFSSGDIVEWPFLENVIVNHCPNLKKFGLGKIKMSQLKSVIMENQLQLDIDTKAAYLFESSDNELSTITQYIIDDNEKLDKAIDNLQPSHFTNLLLFRAKNCDQRLNEFLSILVKRSNKLEAISIEQCKTLDFLFDIPDVTRNEDEDGKYFTQVKEIKLAKLYQLVDIWNGEPIGIFGFKNLQIVHIKSCPFLGCVFPCNVAKKLHQLNELKLESCQRLDEVIKLTRLIKLPLTTIKFPTLGKVEFKSLSTLTQLWLYPVEFPNLKTLMIEKCPQLEEFTTGFATSDPSNTTDGKSLSKLNEFKLDSCPMMVCVISSKTLQELSNLKKLNVSHCKALKMVFNIHGEISHSTELLQQLDELILIDIPKLTHIINKEIVRFYPNLQILQVKQCKSLNWLPVCLMLTKMEISDCEALEKITIIDKEEMGGKVTFFQLKDVSLENLTKISTAFPSTSEFPSLETLKITNCPTLMTFVEESNEVKDLSESTTSNYFFPNSLSLDKLKVLYVINQHVLKLWHYSCPCKSFCELENLTLSNNNKLLSVISSSMIIRFNNLKKLTLDKCELLTEVFSLEDDKPDHNIQEILPQLRALALSNLSSLTCVWNKEPQVPFFPNLVSLFLVHCGSLKSLFSLSSAKNLGRLKLLKLFNCEKIEEIISRVKDENIIFPEMECLVLKDLPKLVNFCQQSRTLDWPNLQIVRVSNIPSMKTFSRGNLSTPLLRSVYITFAKKIWLGNLNETISYIHNNPGIQGRIKLRYGDYILNGREMKECLEVIFISYNICTTQTF